MLSIQLLKRHLSSSSSSTTAFRRESPKTISDSISSFLGQDALSRAAMKRAELEKNMVPRCAVMHLLAKKGIWDGKVPSLHSVFRITEKNFKERFVDRYLRDLPKLIEVYQGKVKFTDFESNL